MISPLTPLFAPRSIAVVGASRTPGTIGRQIVENLVLHGFSGAVYPVHPVARSVFSLPAWRSVREIPAEVDMAVIVVPRERVLDVIDDCGAKGVSIVTVISSGFSEAGPEGAALERELVDRVRRHGMRLVGPNCMGVLSTDPAHSMNATFAPTMPPAGPVSFLSQSGALGVAILDYAAGYQVGIRHFASVGNKPDVSGNDLLEHWESDPETRVILMYLQTFGNPRRFTRIARRLARKKPIVVVKSGRSRATPLANWSHTGALAGEDVAVNALFEQCGVHRADTVEELFDLAMAFAGLPLPKGNRVGIVTNAGGPGVLTADACLSEGLQVATLTPETLDRIAAERPGGAIVRHPLQMAATATPESYGAAVRILLADPGVDAVIAAFVPPIGGNHSAVARSIVEASREHPGHPILAVLMGRAGLPEGRTVLREAGIPAYAFPESAVRALAALHRQREWRDRAVQAPVTFPVDRAGVASLLSALQDEGRDNLTEVEAYRVLNAYGIETPPHALVESEDAAVAAAESIGWPVVLKAISPQIVHRTEIGGVLLDLRSAGELRRGYRELRDRLDTEHPELSISGILVAPYRKEGRELILGMTTDPTFGPVLMFGLGGIYVETFRDVSFRIPPVTEQEALEMVRSIRSYPILAGVRGEAPVRTEAIVRTIQRLSQLVLDHPIIQAIDVNPFLATEEGGLALDARIGLRPRSRPMEEG